MSWHCSITSIRAPHGGKTARRGFFRPFEQRESSITSAEIAPLLFGSWLEATRKWIGEVQGIPTLRGTVIGKKQGRYLLLLESGKLAEVNRDSFLIDSDPIETMPKAPAPKKAEFEMAEYE